MGATKESAAKAVQTRQEKQITFARITGLPKGAPVKVDHPRDRTYHNRKGIVQEHNMGEVGVDFGGSLVWFLPHQLVRV